MCREMTDPHPFTRDGLLGHWRARRHIEDRRARHTAYLAGVAVFSTDHDGLVCRENGRLFLPGGQSLEARRTYLWRFPEPGRIDVLFEDGRPFHSFDPGAPEREVVHPCGEDLYRGCYGVEGLQAWSSRWEVVGPRKNQVLNTRFARL